MKNVPRPAHGRATTSRQILAILTLVFAAPSFAGPGHDGGHDHDEAPVVTNPDAPKRLPDGSVFLPKLSQRQLGIRTVVAETQSLPRTWQWVGKVVMDPNAGGRVQPTIDGRIEAGPRGLPVLGQAVRKGEVLARVRPSANPIERAGQRAQAAELRASLEIAKKQLARLQELEGSVPRKEIEAAQAEVRSLDEQLAAVGSSLSTPEALVTPVSGVIAASNVVAGQVVEAREVLFEIVDPARLQVEAIAHDATQANGVAQASASVDGGQTAFPLAWVGAGRALREQSLPVLFRTVEGTAPPLSVGQPLQVVVQTREQITGIPVPGAALVKNPANQEIVWVHTSAERFVPRTVRHRPLDGATVTITDGLAAGDRVVVQGAALVNQVR
ncbi:efflux RND transporter periplasmic adaptor subunit [Aromatoleum evansii]|uniref:HlyD family efflux transporter periplasmic adaptor subunit n=1 Tax=Aromatoleum evansii TaxID=59406 RepID=A0ABZ1ARX5_AROEV|nr:HlyD family efflux transporter periplasmic adaptor subunit [Aromatoleum evansii]NMG30864.1 HlyD family efflux transporter periplasmic adaptor subunit [Aromatoleum evansii]WRL48627.1 HlyD family efflux transporter periplasmic adaptor subunit [Aromatoleum evansii]